MRYHHTQSASWYLLLLASGIAMFVGAWLTPQWWISFILAGGGGLMLLVGMSFQTLTVRDDGDSLRIQFGPLPLLGKTIRYADTPDIIKQIDM